MRRLIATGTVLLGLAALTIGVDSLADDARPRTVVLVVLDTVRAQNTTLCGYDRPTTPVLQALAAEPDASSSCRAYAPSSWTLPSHASYFTGLDVASHGAGATLGDIPLFGARAQPLREDVPTLAERFTDRGYETALVAANPLVGPRTGLSRGFAIVRTARRWSELRRSHLPRAVDDVLGRIDDDRPLFLAVNILDAHNDWQPVPPGVSWVSERPGMRLRSTRKRFESLPDGPDKAALAAHVRDVYDYALTRADANLGAVLEVLRKHGRLDGSFRIVVTSDHGEYLGEHGRLAHGGTWLHEEVTRVPLVVRDSSGPVDLSGVVSALAVHDLTLDGELPDGARQAFAGKLSNARSDDTELPCATTGAVLWLGHEKLRCRHGALEQIDLAKDPRELGPQPLTEHPGRDRLLRYAERLEATNQGRSSSPELAEQLQALGYVE